MKKRTITMMTGPNKMCDRETFKYFIFLEYKEVNMGPNDGGKCRNTRLQTALYPNWVVYKKRLVNSN